MKDLYAIATWRYEMIAFFFDKTLSPKEQNAALREKLSKAVLWPSGLEEPIPKSTLYRWRRAYEKYGFSGLLPKERKDKGKPRQDRSEWIEAAIHLLLEEPSRSLTILLIFLETKFPKLTLKRVTLYRELKRHSLYPLILRLRKKEKHLRVRFQAKEPHQIWQLDAKGSFPVRLQNGVVLRMVVLTILDDYSRAVLGVMVAATEHLGAAVKLFRKTAARWGLPWKLYMDRHSVYDSLSFRTGLALLGVYRIRSRARNAPARGKIEAYHRLLKAWFVRELKHQEVVDLEHLDELLQATIELLYQNHYHSSIKAKPAEKLNQQLSKRQANMPDLLNSFWVHKRLKTHPKSGEVNIRGVLFRVPKDYAGHRLLFRYDPGDPKRVILIGKNQKEIPLTPAFDSEPQAPKPKEEKRGTGALQRLLDRWRGRELPQAEAGFGLPEVFAHLSKFLERRVPNTESEAILIQDFYRNKGPFARAAFSGALSQALKALGPGRPLGVLLDYVAKLSQPPKPQKEETL